MSRFDRDRSVSEYCRGWLYYEDLANRIKGGVKKEVGARLSESQKKLADEKVKAKALRANEKELKAALAEMTSKNATLALENKRLHARGPGSNNVVRIKG